MFVLVPIAFAAGVITVFTPCILPVLPIVHVLLEGWYNVYDGGDFPEPDYGALNAGASFGQIEGVLSVVNPMMSFDQWKKIKELWRTVREGWSPAD